MIRSLGLFLAILAVSVPPALADALSHPLTLPDAIRLALENSPDFAVAQSRVQAAQAGVQQVTAAFLPQLGASAGYTASDNPVQAFMMTLNQRAFRADADFNRPGTTDDFNANVFARYSLYNGGRDAAERAAVKLNFEAMAQTLDAVRNDLVFEVRRAFYNIQRGRALVRTAGAAVTSLEASLETARNRVEQGAALRTDVLDAEVRLAEARENLLRARNGVALSEVVFRNVLGVGEEENVTAGEAPGTSEPVPTDLEKDDATAPDISQRPELSAARKSVAAAEEQVRGALAGYLPRVDAFASYDVDSGNLSDFAESWLAGLRFEIDVFNGLQTRGEVSEARARLVEARKQLRKLELQLQLEVRQAQLELEEAQARLETTAPSVAQAAESLQITTERYAVGLALFSQLLDAETALTRARQRRAAAEADVLIARAALAKALGRP
jgi:outer membrane protein